jgi:hypothetical protein
VYGRAPVALDQQLIIGVTADGRPLGVLSLALLLLLPNFGFALLHRRSALLHLEASTITRT